MPMPEIGRRAFALGALAAGAALAVRPAPLLAAETKLKPITGGVDPIGAAERLQRLEKARALMRRHGLGAILVEPGASLDYFTGVQWWRSERLTAALIPVDGDPIIFTPFFEEPSVRESLGIPAEIRTWDEHEDPLRLVAGALRDLKLAGRPVGIEETVRFFAVDGLRRALPRVEIRSAAPVVRGCRMIKSPHELTLMQKAADVTDRRLSPHLAADREGHDAGRHRRDHERRHRRARRHSGLRPDPARRGERLSARQRQAAAGARGRGGADGLRLHRPRLSVGHLAKLRLRRGECGAAPGVEPDAQGPGHRLRRRPGRRSRRGASTTRSGASTRAWGYGPGYKLPGTSHRTGHGIGLEGHEPVNFVHGETTKLAPGMCFSNEPGIYLPGKFGIRLEDCLYMTETGPRWFSTPPPSIDRPFD